VPIYFYWGDDDFAMGKAVAALRDRVLDPDWASFNYEKISPDTPDAIIQGLNQSMTPPFGSGSRLVWLVDTTICHHCSADILAELERTLTAIPESTVLLLTTGNKPDGRLKSTKLLQKYAQVQEFSRIPPWQQDRLEKAVVKVAQEMGVKLTDASVGILTESVGNETRLLYSEMEKLQLYVGTGKNRLLSDEIVGTLVTSNAANSLKLANAILHGDTSRALTLIADLIDRNEPALKVVATLTGQFRTWLWVKVMISAGERDEKAIAQAAEIGNPKRIYFLRQEVKAITQGQLQKTLSILLDLEVSLKRGAEELSTLQTKAIELCQVCRP
jgi:DNA polymerase III subunit delta